MKLTRKKRIELSDPNDDKKRFNLDESEFKDNPMKKHVYNICLIKFNCVSVLHIPIVHAHNVSKQIPREKKKFPSGRKCYKTIGSYVSCAFIEI